MKWLGVQITPFSRSLFRLADMDDSGVLNFAEFLKVVCLFATFNEDDVLKFGFELFDEDKSGTVRARTISLHLVHHGCDCAAFWTVQQIPRVPAWHGNLHCCS